MQCPTMKDKSMLGHLGYFTWYTVNSQKYTPPTFPFCTLLWSKSGEGGGGCSNIHLHNSLHVTLVTTAVTFWKNSQHFQWTSTTGNQQQLLCWHLSHYGVVLYLLRLYIQQWGWIFDVYRLPHGVSVRYTPPSCSLTFSVVQCDSWWRFMSRNVLLMLFYVLCQMLESLVSLLQLSHCTTEKVREQLGGVHLPIGSQTEPLTFRLYIRFGWALVSVQSL